MTDPAHPLTLWLARACMACLGVAFLVVASGCTSTVSGFRTWRAAWTLGCVLLAVHILAAFHFEHAWSHAEAWKHVAAQTARVTGISWGGGLYFNFAFLLLWAIDVFKVWRRSTYQKTRLRLATDGASVFMAINATVVFGPAWWFWPLAIFAVAFMACRSAAPSP